MLPMIGEIQLFAGNFAPYGWAFCDGQMLQVDEPLFLIIGSRYGGDGTTNFQLPNLAPLKEADGGQTAIRYIIAIYGFFPNTEEPLPRDESMIGEIRLFAGDFAPKGWDFCSGQTLQIQQETALFSLLGDYYGGDARTKFQLPNLAPLKEADGGETPIRYIISRNGVYPERHRQSYGAMIGQVQLFGSSFVPGAWAACDGASAPIQSNLPLYSILRTQYGGDGKTNFELPNLAPLKEADGGETPIRYIICRNGIYPSRG